MRDMIYKDDAIDIAYKYRADIIAEEIDDLPSAMCEVIRCKDCRFSHITVDGKYCKYCDHFIDDWGELLEMYFGADFFCAYADVKEKE